MIPTFDENKFKYDSFYNDDVAVTRFKFGHDIPILETELNEMQIIQENKMLSFFRKVMPTGFLNLIDDNFEGEKIVFNPNDENGNVLFNHICIAPCNVIVDGQEVKLRGNFSYKGNSEYILINLGEAPQFLEREDFVYLELWYEKIDSTNPLRKHGYQDGEKSSYSIIDKRINEETSRRIAVYWNIRVAENIDFNTYPNGFGYENQFSYSPIKAIANGNCTEQNFGDYIFAPASNLMFKSCEFFNDKNLWVAGRPGVTQMDASLYTDFVFGIPMFKVKRRNKQPYSINNYNGSISYSHALSDELIESYIKGDLSNNIRPDMLFYDFIDKNDIIDLRRLTNINFSKINKMLNETMNKLFNNELTTKSGEKMKRIQIGNIPPDYNSNLVNFFIKFDKNITPFFINKSDPVFNVKYKNDEETDLIYEKSISGYGLLMNGDYELNYEMYNDDNNGLIGTLDFFLQPNWFGIDNNNQKIVSLNSKNNKKVIDLYKAGNNLLFNVYQYEVKNDIETSSVSTITVDLENTLLMAKNIYHIRLSWSTQESTMMCFIYINGKMVGQENIYKNNSVLPKHLVIGSCDDNDSSFIIEDLLFYNKIFENNIGDYVNKVFSNEYWPNLPKDFIKGDTLMLPSLDGNVNILSDNEIIQKDAISYNKIIENILTLELTNGNKIDYRRIPDVYDKNGNKLIGNWTGLGESTAKFSLSEIIDDEEIMPDESEVIILQDNLDLIDGYIKYEYSQELTTLINDNVVSYKPQLMKDKSFAIIVTNSVLKKIKIVDVTDKSNTIVLFDDVMKDGIDVIDGYILNLKDVELDSIIANNSLTVFNTFAPIIIKPEISFETFGNINHVHYSQEFHNLINSNIEITNEKEILSGRYLIYIKDVAANTADQKIYIKDMNTKVEKEYDMFTPINYFNGITISIESLYSNAKSFDGVIINTVKGNINDGKFTISNDVDILNNYDASLKDYINKSIKIVDQNALIDAKYELIITNISTPSIKIVKYEKSVKTLVYQGPVKTNITDIPGISFDCNVLPEFSYISDAIIINTFAKTGTIPGNYNFETNIKYDDNYSEVFANFMTPNISVSDEFALVDNYYDLSVTDSIGSKFKITNTLTQELIFEGEVGSQDVFTVIPGLNIVFSSLPPKCNKNDTVLIKTNAVKFEDVKYENSDVIPFIHFSQELYDILNESLKLFDLSLIENNSYVIQVVDSVDKLIEIKTIDGELIYEGGPGHNLNCIPGVLFNIINIDNINELGTVIITTNQIIIGIDAIVQYDIIVSNGNAGFDIQNDILAAGIINNNFDNITEISFNRFNTPYRKISYIRPRLEQSADSYDLAYDFSNTYKVDISKYDTTPESMQLYYNELANENHNGFVRRLIYHVSPKDINTYYIPESLYGYKVIGVISVIGKQIIGCKKVNDSVDSSKKYFEVVIDNVDKGKALKFELALGGMSFDYETNSKTLMRDIVKTYDIEFESEGVQDYAIPLNIAKYGYGLIKSTFSMKFNKLIEYQGKNLISYDFKNVAYVDDDIFIDTNFSGEDGKKVIAEYTIDEESYSSPILKIHFENYPKKGTKIRIPALISYYPKNEIISLWYNNTPYQGIITSSTSQVKRLTDWKFFTTTLSSSKDNNMGNLNNIINRLPGGLIYSYKIGGQDIKLESFNIDEKCNFMMLNDYVTNDINSHNFITDPYITIYKNSINFQDAKIKLDNEIKIYFNNLTTAINKYVGAYCLVENTNKELMILILGDLCTNESKNIVFSPKYGDLFRINNAPIIK